MLSERSKQLRRDAYKLSKANGGYHYGGTFSAIEILIALYDIVLKPNDKFILSKGHSCWGYYVLLRERRFNPKLESHPHLDIHNGIDFTTGSEGHGLPAGVGMAMARKHLKRNGRIYVVMGDGECQEGTTWESLLTAPFRKLDNLVVIVDYNGIQSHGFVKDILPVNHIGKVAQLCGWNVSEVNGHAVDELVTALKAPTSAPRLIIAHTVKGYGVSFMENSPKWHCKWPNEDEEKIILEELK
jgi:transketolase